LGLGKIIGNEISLYQIIFSRILFLDIKSLLYNNQQLVKKFSSSNKKIQNIKVSLYIFDPVMNKEDHDFLLQNMKEFNFSQVFLQIKI